MKKVEIGFWGVESILEFVSIAGACKEKNKFGLRRKNGKRKIVAFCPVFGHCRWSGIDHS